MKVVFVKKNNYTFYDLSNLVGYTFNPRKSISNLNIIDDNMIKFILSKKIKREINKTKKAIMLIVKSNMAINSDCEIMYNELIRIIKKLDNRYRKYFNEFEYFDLIKELYVLKNIINYKNKIIEE